MKSVFQKPKSRTDTGLGSNDALGFLPVALSAILGVYYAKRRSELTNSYAKALNKSDSYDLIAQIPFLKTGDTNYIEYDEISTKQSEIIEANIINMFRSMESQTENDSFLGQYTREGPSVSEDALGQIRASRNARLRRLGLLGEKPNSDKDPKPDPRNTSWWVARYTFRSLFRDEKPEARFLPVSFVMGSMEEGEPVTRFGGVKSIVVETDADFLGADNTAKNVGMKIYMDLCDTNFMNDKDQVRVLVSQENDLNLQARIVDSEGKVVKGTSVSHLELKFTPEAPVQYSDSVFEKYSLERGSPEWVTLLSNPYSQALLLFRSLPEIQNNVKLDVSGSPIVLASKSTQDTLPLRIVARGSGANQWDLQKDVNKIHFTTTGNFAKTPLDLSNRITSLTFELSDGTLIYKTTDQPWSRSDGPGDPPTILEDPVRLDLEVFSESSPREPSGSKEPNVSYFKDFKAANGKISSYDIAAYLETHANNPKLAVGSLSLDEETEETIPRTDYTFLATVFILFSALVVSFASPSGQRAFTLGRITFVIGLLLFVTFLGVLPILLTFRDDTSSFITSFDESIPAITTAFLAICLLTVTQSVPYIEGPSWLFYLVSALLVVTSRINSKFKWSEPLGENEEIVQLKTGLYILSGLCIYLMVSETYKLCKKASVSPVAKMTSGFESVSDSPNIARFFFLLVLGIPLILVLAQSSGIGCSRLMFLRDRAEKSSNKLDKDDTERKSYYDQEKVHIQNMIESDSLCTAGENSWMNWTKTTVISISIILTLLLFVTTPLVTAGMSRLFPSCLRYSVRQDYIESAPQPNLFFLFLFTFLICRIALSLLPFVDWQTPECSYLNGKVTEFKEDKNSLAYDLPRKLDQIEDGMASYSCMTTSGITTSVFFVALYVLASTSMVVPHEVNRVCGGVSVLSIVLLCLFSAVALSISTEYEDLPNVNWLQLQKYIQII